MFTRLRPRLFLLLLAVPLIFATSCGDENRGNSTIVYTANSDTSDFDDLIANMKGYDPASTPEPMSLLGFGLVSVGLAALNRKK